MAKDNLPSLGPSFDIGVPKDEYDLACAVAEAKSRGLTGTTGMFYRDAEGVGFASLISWNGSERTPVACCALGAVALCKNESASRVMEDYPYGPVGNDEGKLGADSEAALVRELVKDGKASAPGFDLGRAYAHIMDLRPDDDA